ncbi:MAG: cysteine desulfurase family protein, partial [Pseudomonadota bacterium]
MPVYLDYNATAPIRLEVIESVSAAMAEVGNASSVHQFGQRTRAHVETARKHLADLINVTPNQIVFTSGATESNNTALHAFQGKRVLISAIEHPAVLEAAPQAEHIPVTKDGVIDLDAFEKMLNNGEPPAMVSVMLVNSETGAIQPLKTIAKLAKDKGALVHTDAVQAAGRILLDFNDLGIDFMSLSAHKMAGPQGVGAFIFRSGLTFEKFMKGGTQERMQRGGTINVAGIAGFGKAAELAAQNIDHYDELAKLRDHMEAEIL